VESTPGVMTGVGLYWRYEKWLRKQESRLHSTVGVTGAISAVRRELFRTIPQGTILDDVYWPLLVAMQGKRVVHDGRAKAFDGVYRFIFWLEIIAGTLGLAGLINWIGTRSRVAAAAASFLVLNTAAWLAFWVWASGRASRSWSKISYEVTPLSYSTNT